MDISYDIWEGESLQTVIPSIAAFRKQVLVTQTHIQQASHSQECQYLDHYFCDDAKIIVANDGGNIIGYIGLVSGIEFHDALSEYRFYDLLVSEGPIIHPEFRSQGIGQSLLSVACNECQTRAIELFAIDASHVLSSTFDSIAKHVAHNMGFTQKSNQIWLKTINDD